MMNLHVELKQINDSLGHLAGDAVLRELARRLQGSLRAYDFIGRYGGEEFLAVIPSCSPGDLAAGAERIRRCVADRPIATPAGEISCTISLGVASASLHSGNLPEYELLLRISDEALYLAKANGRNRVEISPHRQAVAQAGSG
ncbi:MAG TPA: GGDEF domain-containing protein [Terriglobales bacterium]|jgi:diguanylate cyclase (GGDEF)-like protein